MDGKTPLGMTITLYDTTKLTVIGVVENFYTNGIWEKIHPTVLRLTSTDDYRVLVVRAEPKDLHDVLDYLSTEMEKPGNKFYFRRNVSRKIH